MRNLLSTVAVFSTANETGSSEPIPAENAVIDAAPIVADRERAAAERKAKAAALKAKRDAAGTGKPSGKRAAKATKPEAEAKPDNGQARAERIAAERQAAADLYAHFESGRSSKPVKALSAATGTSKPRAVSAHPSGRNPSARQAAAIACAFAASGKKLAPGNSAPRVFEISGIRYFIENGCLSDAIASGLVTVNGNDNPLTSTIRLSPKADKTIIGLIGQAATKIGKLT